MLAFIAAMLISRLAVTPFHCRITASGAIIEPPAFLTIPVAAIAAILAVGLVYLVESRHTNDPCVRRHRFWDMTEIVAFMVLYESVSSFCSRSPWWRQLAIVSAGMTAILFGKSLLRRSVGR